MPEKILTSPYDLVAEALQTDVASINDESSMSNHPKWDSLNHVDVIVAIEDKYSIAIPDKDVMKYTNMAAIITLYKELQKSS